MPCFDLFREQPVTYQKQVLGEGIPVLSVETAATFGWSEFSHLQFGLDRFGASATIAQLQDKFGFNPETVAEEARKLAKYYEGRKAPSLFAHPARRVLKTGGH